MMTIEQWIQVGIPAGLIIGLFLFSTMIVWPYLAKRRDKLDAINEARRIEIDKQYAERHEHYIGSIDAIKEAIYSQAQTQLTIGNEHAALLAGITKHLEEADRRVIEAIARSKNDIIQHIDHVAGSNGFDPHKSDRNFRG